MPVSAGRGGGFDAPSSAAWRAGSWCGRSAANRSLSRAAPAEGDAEAARIRRTLPGRTTISGSAHPDVRDVTIQTPRDVRTLRPSGRSRSFLAVYDGEFFSGKITLTARFADGTTSRHVMPVGGP